MTQKNNTNEGHGSIQQILTRIVFWQGKINAYNRATDRQKRAIASSAAQDWILNKLNSGKTTTDSAQETQLAELRFLYENKLITDEEYKEKRASLKKHRSD